MRFAPTFTRVASTLGHGLQRNIGASLTAANHGGVTVRVTSLDSSIVLVSPSVSTAGTGSYDTVILPGATSIPLVISAIPTGRVAQPGPAGGKPAELFRAGRSWKHGGPIRRPRRTSKGKQS